MSNAKLSFAAVALAAVMAAQPSAGQTPAPMPARAFAMAAAASDEYEIQAARVAMIESRRPDVRAFAQQMVTDHAQTSQTLRQAIMSSGMTPPPMALSGDGQKLLAELQSLNAPDFDRVYAKQQVLAHQEALVVEQGYAANGTDPNIRQAAQSAVPIVQHHLDMAKRLVSNAS